MNQYKNKSFPTLFSALNLNQISLKNRISLAPMTRTSATEDGQATERMAKYYQKFARGGFALIITEGVYPDEKYSQGYPYQPGLANEKHINAWKQVTQAVHQEGGHIFAQIQHAGAISQGSYYTEETIAPSAFLPKRKPLKAHGGKNEWTMPREMNKEEIAETIRSFGKAAVRAVEAGFDGIEIHAANGYLLDQFLTDYTNQRTDEYGGSIENRVRLLCEVVQEMQKHTPADFVVGIRMAQSKVNDFHHVWVGGEEDAAVIFSSLDQAGVDYIHVTTESHALHPAFGEQGATLAALAKKYSNVPIIANGDLGNPEEAEEILARGEADLVALARPALTNSDWPERVHHGIALRSYDNGALNSIFTPIANIKDEEL